MAWANKQLAAVGNVHVTRDKLHAPLAPDHHWPNDKTQLPNGVWGVFFFLGTKQQMKTWSTKTLHDLVEYSGAARQPLRSCTAHIHLMKTLTMAVHAKAAR